MKVKRKIYRKITKNRLDECLALVGWSTRHYGCGYFRLINGYGNTSNFITYCRDGDENKTLQDLKIEEFNKNKPFGDSPKDLSFVNNGILSFQLRKCLLEVIYFPSNEEVDFVSISTSKEQEAFVLFTPKFVSKN